MAVCMVIILLLAHIPFSQEYLSTCGDALNSSVAVGDELTDSDFAYTSTMVDNGELSQDTPLPIFRSISLKGWCV